MTLTPSVPTLAGKCPLIATWFTFRQSISQEPKRRGNQCAKITQWFCNGGKGKASLSNERVLNVYCKNELGRIVYCDSQYGTPACTVPRGEAGCTGFSPECSTNKRLDCSDSSVGDQLFQFSDGSGGFTYIDSTGRSNCAYKYGILYRDFVDTCYNNYRELTNSYSSLGTVAREEQNVQMRPCLPWVPPEENGGARGFAEYFVKSGVSYVGPTWTAFEDPAKKLARGDYTGGTSDAQYIEELKGASWPNILKSVDPSTNTLTSTEVGVVGEYMGFNMAPWLDGSYTGLHENNVSFTFSNAWCVLQFSPILVLCVRSTATEKTFTTTFPTSKNAPTAMLPRTMSTAQTTRWWRAARFPILRSTRSRSTFRTPRRRRPRRRPRRRRRPRIRRPSTPRRPLHRRPVAPYRRRNLPRRRPSHRASCVDASSTDWENWSDRRDPNDRRTRRIRTTLRRRIGSSRRADGVADSALRGARDTETGKR